jgi:hypothetical protein
LAGNGIAYLGIEVNRFPSPENMLDLDAELYWRLQGNTLIDSYLTISVNTAAFLRTNPQIGP